MADPTQIHQVLMNLCTNAAHAMGEKGGILEVSLQDFVIEAVALWPASTADLQPGPVRPPDRWGTKRVDLTLPSRVKYSNRFLPPKSREKEVGLGLSVVHGIVTSHGRAELYSGSERAGHRHHIPQLSHHH